MTTRPQAPEPLRSPVKAIEAAMPLHFAATAAAKGRVRGAGIIRVLCATGPHDQGGR